MSNAKKRALKRRLRVRSGLGSSAPRLSVFRSNKYIWAQIIDDNKRETLAASSSKALKDQVSAKKNDVARKVGLALAAAAKAKKIIKVVFDRGSYKYHGRVKELAEGAREGGLKF